LAYKSVEGLEAEWQCAANADERLLLVQSIKEQLQIFESILLPIAAEFSVALGYEEFEVVGLDAFLKLLYTLYLIDDPFAFLALGVAP
jgi:hypothetical protein